MTRIRFDGCDLSPRSRRGHPGPATVARSSDRGEHTEGFAATRASTRATPKEELPVKRALTILLVAFAAWPAAAAADPARGQDRENGARACRQLQTTMDAATFKTTYRTFGGCVSKWTQAQHQNRHEAEQACASEPRQGGKFARCVAAKLRAESASDVEATLSAARTCKAQRKADAASFSAAYGTAANAYGKCVSRLAAKKDAQTTP